MAQNRNEGEGSRTAAKQYNDATEKFAKSGRVEPAAKEAERAVDGDEAGELARAEKEGKDRAKPQSKH
ncbi:MAG: hypothetical protein AB7E79_06520 [Rhodospirillaceae bacterium]